MTDSFKFLLQRRGVDPREVRFVAVQAGALDQLRAGRVDAVVHGMVLGRPALTELGLTAHEDVVAQAVQEASGGTIRDAFNLAFASHAGYARDHPEVIRAFRKSLNDAIDHLETHDAEARALLQERYKVTPEVAAAAVFPIWKVEVEPEEVAPYVTISRAVGSITGAPDVDRLVWRDGRERCAYRQVGRGRRRAGRRDRLPGGSGRRPPARCRQQPAGAARRHVRRCQRRDRRRGRSIRHRQDDAAATPRRACSAPRPEPSHSTAYRSRVHRATVAMVFQDYHNALLPWRTVARNVAIGLEHRIGQEEWCRRVEQALRMVDLQDRGADYPWRLSGGMAQRVQIARALALEADVLLMDEPFGALDAMTKASLQDVLLGVHRATGATIVFVTHDVDEAIYLSDRVLVLAGTPGTISATVPTGLPTRRDQLDDPGAARYLQVRHALGQALRAGDDGG